MGKRDGGRWPLCNAHGRARSREGGRTFLQLLTSRSASVVRTSGLISKIRVDARPHPGPTAVELRARPSTYLLPLPARHEREEGWGEGNPHEKRPSSPRPSPLSDGGEGEVCAIFFPFLLNSTPVHPGPLPPGPPGRGRNSRRPRPSPGLSGRHSHGAQRVGGEGGLLEHRMKAPTFCLTRSAQSAFASATLCSQNFSAAR